MVLMMFKRIANHGLWGLLSAGLTLFIGFVFLYAYMYLHLPSVSGLKEVKFQAPMRILASDGQLIAEFGTKRRIPIEVDQVPKHLIMALLATEDQRFYQHEGVDFRGIARAAMAVISSGRKVQGASTITMQVARNFFLTRKKSYQRKINEILLAIKIEHTLTKDEILGLYLNKVFFGHRAYGIAAAAQVYYGKPLKELTLAQMAMLAGLPQAPSRSNPLTSPVLALERRNHVLERLLELKEITKSEYDQSIQAPITASYHDHHVEVNAPYVAEMVRQDIIDHLGEARAMQGLEVVTTIDSRLQKKAQQALRNGLVAYSMRHGYIGREGHINGPLDQDAWVSTLKSYRVVADLVPAAIVAVDELSAKALLSDGSQITIKWPQMRWARYRTVSHRLGPKRTSAKQILTVGDVVRVKRLKSGVYALRQLPQVQGALIASAPHTAQVVALVGGFSFSQSRFNRATQARRQAGSIFKPFIYSAALNQGYTWASIINDSPIVMKDSGENSLWRPNNDNFSFNGPTRLLVGLNQSRNLVSIRLLQAIGIPYALDYVSRFGFNKTNLPNSLSLALGSGETSPLQMIQGFNVFATGGYRLAPYLVKTIRSNGEVIYEHTTPLQMPGQTLNDSLRVIDADNAYLMTVALRSVIKNGTGRRAMVLKRQDLSGKTGTTNHKVDAWFAGFNHKFSSVVWVGYDDQTSLQEFGSQAALPIWIDFMREALKGVKEVPLTRPADIVVARIDAKTGLLAMPGDPHAIFQEFRSKYLPKSFSDSSQNVSDAFSEGVEVGAPDISPNLF